MVTTQFKAKLSKRLSYPLGAEVVSRALAGAPQFEQLRLWFSDHPGTSAMEFQQVLREGRPYVVLQAAFKRWSMNLSACNSMIASGWYDKKWQIVVYAVLREHRHAARSALLRHALRREEMALAARGDALGERPPAAGIHLRSRRRHVNSLRIRRDPLVK